MKRKVFRFVLVGVSAVAIDFTIYIWLVEVGTPTYFSRGISYFTTLLYAYFANTYYAFRVNYVSWNIFSKYCLLYVSVLFFNVLLNEKLLLIFGKEYYSLVIIYVFVTGVSAVINFIGLKQYVFFKINV